MQPLNNTITAARFAFQKWQPNFIKFILFKAFYHVPKDLPFKSRKEKQELQIYVSTVNFGQTQCTANFQSSNIDSPKIYHIHGLYNRNSYNYVRQGISWEAIRKLRVTIANSRHGKVGSPNYNSMVA